MKTVFLQHILLVAVLIWGFVPNLYSQDKSADLNAIKKQPDKYIWAEFTATALEQAQEGATLLLKTKMENETTPIKMLYCMRGDLYRVLAFADKLSVADAETKKEHIKDNTVAVVDISSEVVGNLVPSQDTPSALSQMKINEIADSPMCKQMLLVTNEVELGNLYQRWRLEKKVTSYGRKRDIPSLDCYIFVYNRSGKLCAYLYKCNNRIVDVQYKCERNLQDFLTADYGLYWIR